MLQKTPHFFFGTPFIYFGNREAKVKSSEELSCMPEIQFMNGEKIGLFLHWFESEEDFFDDESS